MEGGGCSVVCRVTSLVQVATPDASVFSYEKFLLFLVHALGSFEDRSGIHVFTYTCIAKLYSYDVLTRL